MPWLAFCEDAATVLFDDPAGQRQAQADAFDLLRAGRLRAIEAIKNMRERFRGNADSVVLDTQSRFARFGGRLTVTRPPSGVNLMALSRRLRMTRSIQLASPRIWTLRFGHQFRA